MANLTIRGYGRLMKDAQGGSVMCGDESALYWQHTLAFTGTAGTVTVPAQQNIKFVRLASDSAQNTWFNIGPDDAAVGANEADLLQGAEYFGVSGGMKISAVEG